MGLVDWELASRMLKSGLLEHYDLVMDLAHKTEPNQTRQFDFDALDSYINGLEALVAQNTKLQEVAYGTSLMIQYLIS